MKDIDNNERYYYEDIICARATPSGTSAVAIIRVSGKDSWQLLSQIFKPNNPKFKKFETHRCYYGSVVVSGEVVDSVLVTTFKSNMSFTGEESFEINCHGSEIIVALILKHLTEFGARLAEPGEFSKRAFLNGKINLAQAESIMDIVHSSTKQSALLAVRQLSGRLTNEINEIKDKLTDLLADIEVYIDYPEEDLKIDEERWKSSIININDLIDDLLKGFERGKFYREGIETVLLGRTNSGKSTMFNYLLDFDKAIVSDIHGTTRDYIDAIINICGYGVRIYDTAGLRESNDPIEIEGTKRAKDLANSCDIVLYLIGADFGFDEEDKKNITTLPKDKKLLIIINKVELTDDQGKKLTTEIETYINTKIDNYKIITMSGLKKSGIDSFNKNFVTLLVGQGDQKNIEDGTPILTNIRHKNLLESAQKSIINALKELENELLDIVAFEIRTSLDYIGSVTGEVTPNDVLNKIFSTFCVGK